MATVYYWKYTKQNVGHLSLSLNNGIYISHWPEDGAKPFSLPMRGCPVASLEEDIEREGHEPDEEVTLPPGMIDIEKIKLWWNSQIQSGTSYQLLFSNCAQMVRNALLKGGMYRHQPEILRAILAGSEVIVTNIAELQATDITPHSILTWVKYCKKHYDDCEGGLD